MVFFLFAGKHENSWWLTGLVLDTAFFLFLGDKCIYVCKTTLKCISGTHLIRCLIKWPFTFYFFFLSWYVQHTRNAELVATDNWKPTTYAEYVVSTLYEKHDAVIKPESWSCSTGKCVWYSDILMYCVHWLLFFKICLYDSLIFTTE